jgi:uncharacterized membrane protein AbrB (regulator of aidB expression)
MISIVKKYKKYYGILLGALIGFIIHFIIDNTINLGTIGNLFSYIVIFILVNVLMTRSIQKEIHRQKIDNNLYEEYNPVDKYYSVFSKIKHRILKD